MRTSAMRSVTAASPPKENRLMASLTKLEIDEIETDCCTVRGLRACFAADESQGTSLSTGSAPSEAAQDRAPDPQARCWLRVLRILYGLVGAMDMSCG